MNELYPYQQTGAAFLAANRRAYLADEMGLGKTVQAIAAAKAVRPSYVCVVCPASVIENWKREWAAWWPEYKGGLNVVSYSKLIRFDGLPINPLPPDSLVILDEAHYCKSPSAKRTKAALSLARQAKYAWLLSGTPVPNDARELWPVMKYLWPEIPKKYGITSAFGWMDKWCVWADSDYGYRVWGNKPPAKKELARDLREIMLRRKLEDVAMELPPLRVDKQYLPRNRELAQTLAALGVEDQDTEHMSVLRRVLGEYKAPVIGKIIADELVENQYQQVVVLYHHKKTGALLREIFDVSGLSTLGFDGSTPNHARQQAVDDFQTGGARVFLAQQTAAGVGITLTTSHEIVLVEPSWSPSENEQAIKRIHRIGQDCPCRARIFVVPDSLDEALMATVTRKTRMVREVLDD